MKHNLGGIHYRSDPSILSALSQLFEKLYFEFENENKFTTLKRKERKIITDSLVRGMCIYESHPIVTQKWFVTSARTISPGKLFH